jgi:hypothetical protein
LGDIPWSKCGINPDRDAGDDEHEEEEWKG